MKTVVTGFSGNNVGNKIVFFSRFRFRKLYPNKTRFLIYLVLMWYVQYIV